MAVRSAPGSAPRSPRSSTGSTTSAPPRRSTRSCAAAATGIGLTTVYRTLQALADGGEVDVLRSGSGEAVYRRCASAEHHHHLVCRRCGAAVEIEGPAVETWAQAVAERHGFSDLSHTVEIFGLCRECSSQIDTAPGRRDD